MAVLQPSWMKDGNGVPVEILYIRRVQNYTAGLTTGAIDIGRERAISIRASADCHYNVGAAGVTVAADNGPRILLRAGQTDTFYTDNRTHIAVVTDVAAAAEIDIIHHFKQKGVT
jgi:hypothetical protein